MPAEKSFDHLAIFRFYGPFDEFYRCENCGKVYWKGSHYRELDAWLKKITRSMSQNRHHNK